MKKIGYQGKNGTFSEIAAMQYFSSQEVECIGYNNFPDIFKAVESEQLYAAALPVENTTTGIISRTYDLFNQYDIHAVGEINEPICHNLIVVPGTKIEQIREVFSHPEALSQCRHFFENHPDMQEMPYQDTAKAVEYVRECGDPSKAALGSWRAAEYYSMESLMENVQDSSANMTRFLIIRHSDEIPEDADKISFMIILRDHAGSLYNALGILAKNGINILRLESRPLQGRRFEYLFYIDISGDIHDRFVRQALKELAERSIEMKIFGAYKRAAY